MRIFYSLTRVERKLCERIKNEAEVAARWPSTPLAIRASRLAADDIDHAEAAQVLEKLCWDGVLTPTAAEYTGRQNEVLARLRTILRSPASSAQVEGRDVVHLTSGDIAVLQYMRGRISKTENILQLVREALADSTVLSAHRQDEDVRTGSAHLIALRRSGIVRYADGTAVGICSEYFPSCETSVLPWSPRLYICDAGTRGAKHVRVRLRIPLLHLEPLRLLCSMLHENCDVVTAATLDSNAALSKWVRDKVQDYGFVYTILPNGNVLPNTHEAVRFIAVTDQHKLRRCEDLAEPYHALPGHMYAQLCVLTGRVPELAEADTAPQVPGASVAAAMQVVPQAVSGTEESAHSAQDDTEVDSVETADEEAPAETAQTWAEPEALDRPAECNPAVWEVALASYAMLCKQREMAGEPPETQGKRLELRRLEELADDLAEQLRKVREQLDTAKAELPDPAEALERVRTFDELVRRHNSAYEDVLPVSQAHQAGPLAQPPDSSSPDNGSPGSEQPVSATAIFGRQSRSRVSKGNMLTIAQKDDILTAVLNAGVARVNETTRELIKRHPDWNPHAITAFAGRTTGGFKPVFIRSFTRNLHDEALDVALERLSRFYGTSMEDVRGHITRG